MSVELKISIGGDTATPAIRSKIAACKPHTIATRIAPPLAEYWRDHLVSLPRNKHGYPSTGFYEDAARRVNGIAVDGDCVLSCDKLGIRQRLKGGTVTATNAENITIPIAEESYGTTVADWGRDNLTLVIMPDGKKFLCLWLGTSELGSAYKAANVGKKAKSGAAVSNRAQKFNSASKAFERPKVIIFRKGSGASAGKVQKHMDLKFLFVLKHSVDQGPFPDIIPADMAYKAKQEVLKAIQA